MIWASLGSFLSHPPGDRFPAARQCQGRDQAQIDARRKQPIRQRAMIVAGGLEPGHDRLFEARQKLDQPIVICARVEDGQPPAPRPTRYLDQDLIAMLGDVDRYQDGAIPHILGQGHGRSPLRWRLATSL